MSKRVLMDDLGGLFPCKDKENNTVEGSDASGTGKHLDIIDTKRSACGTLSEQDRFTNRTRISCQFVLISARIPMLHLMIWETDT